MDSCLTVISRREPLLLESRPKLFFSDIFRFFRNHLGTTQEHPWGVMDDIGAVFRPAPENPRQPGPQTNNPKTPLENPVQNSSRKLQVGFLGQVLNKGFIFRVKYGFRFFSPRLFRLVQNHHSSKSGILLPRGACMSLLDSTRPKPQNHKKPL